MDRRAHAILDAWHARFRELDLVGPAAVVAFGAPESNGDDALPALDLDARHPSGQPVVLVGDTWPVVLDGPAALSLSTAATPQARHLEERRYVRGFVDLLALRAAGALSRRPHAHVHVILGGARQPEPRSWRLGSVEEATAHLSLLARELFAGPHDYLLPVEAWRRWQDADDELSLADHVRALRDAAWVRTSDDYGPLPGPARLGPHADLGSPREVEAVAARPRVRNLRRVGDNGWDHLGWGRWIGLLQRALSEAHSADVPVDEQACLIVAGG